MNTTENLIFQDVNKAREWLETRLWPHGPVCPHCGVVNSATELQGYAHRAGVYQCNESACREQFTVTVGTVFERSKIPLNKWLMALFLMCSSKKGISSHQMHRMLGVSYKSTWFMTHRIREAMKPKASGKIGGGGIVEADETYVGRKPGTKVRRGHGHKNAVFSLVERAGTVRSFHVPDVTADTLKDKLNKHVAKSARLMTDDAGQYEKVGKMFLEHQAVNHSAGEYVRGDAHTNTVEGYFSIIKRGVYGTFHHVSSQHLKRYVTEFDFRYNRRAKLGISDMERTEMLAKGIKGKRLMYRTTDTQAQA